MTEAQILAALALIPSALATLFALGATAVAWFWFANAHEFEQLDAFVSAATGTIVSSAFLAASIALVLFITGVI